MFGFQHNSTSQRISPALHKALSLQGVPAEAIAAGLNVHSTQGQYAGRSVRYFQVFDQQRAVVGSGHMERDGAVTLTALVVSAEGPTPVRHPADRAAHLDDERLVFWDADASLLSVAHLSMAAAAWLNARASHEARPAPAIPRLAPAA